jgi:hypothetical protein
MVRRTIGVLGATSLVGVCLLTPDTTKDLNADAEFVAFTRRSIKPEKAVSGCRVTWRSLRDSASQEGMPSIEYWICLAPVWVLPDYFALLEGCGARRVVVLSSTSRFTKTDSRDRSEQRVVASLISGERQLIDWAEKRNIAWVILRPTLIYGLGRDKNIASIAGFIRRFGFFPLLGPATGLRQPIHACDVAKACFQALMHSNVVNQAYNISGGETLAYNDMVRRVFAAMGRKSRFLHVPHAVFRLVLPLSRLVPRFGDVSMDVAERMNQDLIFDHTDAARDFSFSPGDFLLDSADVA